MSSAVLHFCAALVPASPIAHHVLPPSSASYGGGYGGSRGYGSRGGGGYGRGGWDRGDVTEKDPFAEEVGAGRQWC